MLFNSLGFGIFLPIVFLLYWLVTNKNLKAQNLLLLLSSYFFYACWDWRFLFLLIFSTGLDFYTGIKLDNSQNQGAKKFWFWLSIIVNLGFLLVFKYFNFFAESFGSLINTMGFNVNPWTLKVILPVGISFYTFHGLSYVIDIYKCRIKAERNFIDYSVFVSFFPLLVAGPIERATHLLPQIKKKRMFNYPYAVLGLKQILWGLFKKIVIADQCAEFSNLIFNNSDNYGGVTLILGAVFFAFQIYGDFSGYSDIAIGTAKLFGIDLLRNFSFPYFSRDIAEFWRRWHISLSSWFRDYLYIPLGGNKGGSIRKCFNTVIIFTVSGFWHGANWTFIFWGLLNAIYFIPLLLSGKNRSNMDIVAHGKFLPSVKELFQMIFTFSLTVLAWIFFRSNDIGQAKRFINAIFSGIAKGSNYIETCKLLDSNVGYFIMLMMVLFILIEWMGREGQFAIEYLFSNSSRPVRWVFYYLIAFVTILYSGSKQEFIYFQF